MGLYASEVFDGLLRIGYTSPYRIRARFAYEHRLPFRAIRSCYLHLPPNVPCQLAERLAHHTIWVAPRVIGAFGKAGRRTTDFFDASIFHGQTSLEATRYFLGGVFASRRELEDMEREVAKRLASPLESRDQVPLGNPGCWDGTDVMVVGRMLGAPSRQFVIAEIWGTSAGKRESKCVLGCLRDVPFAPKGGGFAYVIAQRMARVMFDLLVFKCSNARRDLIDLHSEPKQLRVAAFNLNPSAKFLRYVERLARDLGANPIDTCA